MLFSITRLSVIISLCATHTVYNTETNFLIRFSNRGYLGASGEREKRSGCKEEILFHFF